MAILNFCGFETGDNAEAQSATGTNSFSTTTVRTGTYSLRINPVTSANGNLRFAAMGANGTATTSFGTASLYSRFYFRIATAPASADEEFYVVLDTGGSEKATFRINSSRQIVAYNNSGTLVATGTTALSLNTWYRIEILTSTGAGSQAYEVKIDGVSELSGTMNMLTNNHGSVRVGKGTNRNSQTVDFFFDDCCWSDSGYPGAGQCDRLAPDSNGATMQFSAGTNASNYLEVDEIPTDTDTTYVASSGSANQTALFGYGAMASASSINSVKAWARARSVAGASSTKLRIVSGASNTETTAADWTTSYVQKFKLANTDPNTGSAWAQSAVSAIEAGVIEANAIVNRFTTASLFVDYVPGGGAPAQNSNFLGIL